MKTLETSPREIFYMFDVFFQDAAGFLGEGILRKGIMKYITSADCERYYSNYDVTFDSTMSCAYNEGKTTMCVVGSLLLRCSHYRIQFKSLVKPVVPVNGIPNI